MWNDRRRSTAAPAPSPNLRSAKNASPGQRRRSSGRRLSTKSVNASADSSTRIERRRQSTLAPARTPSANNSTTVPEAATAEPALSTPLDIPPSLRLPLSGGKKARKESVIAARFAEGEGMKTPAASSADTNKDSAVGSVAAPAVVTLSRLYNSSMNSIANSSGGPMSRGGSMRISPGASPAPPSSLMMPINEIHGSLAQLYLTPISTSLSSSSPQAGFTALHFDGRSASWSNGASGTSAAATATAAPGAASSPPKGSQFAHRRSSSSAGGGPVRGRKGSSGDNSSGLRRSSDSGIIDFAVDSSLVAIQQLQQHTQARSKGPPLSPHRARNSVHGSADGRPRPTFSTMVPEAATADPTHANPLLRTSAPPSSPPSSVSPASMETPLSVTNAALFATSNTVAIPQTPPMAPPLMSTYKPSSLQGPQAGRRLPPTPPPLEGNAHFVGYSASESGEGGSSSSPEGRRGSWNLVSNWAPSSSSPTSPAVLGSPSVVKASRRISRGGSLSTGETGRSNSVLELSEDQFMPDEGQDFLMQRRSFKKPSIVTTASANSRTTAVPCSDGSTRQPQSSEDGSPEQSMFSFSVSFASGATSMFDDLPPPAPPPPAQLNLGGAVGGTAGRHHVGLPDPLPSAMSASPGEGSSVSLFLDTNTWNQKEAQRRNSTSSSFSIRQVSTASLFPGGGSGDGDESLREGDHGNHSGGGGPLARHGSFFSTSRVSIGGAEPFTLAPSTACTAAPAGHNRYPASQTDMDESGGGESGLVRHNASYYGGNRGSWSDLRQGSGGPPPLLLQPGAQSTKPDGETELPATTTSSALAAGKQTEMVGREGPRGGASSRPPKAPPVLRASEQADAGDVELIPPPESSIVLKERVTTSARLTATGEEISSRQQELAQSFRNRIQVGVRAPKRKQTVRRVSSSSRSQQRRGSASDGSSSGSHRSSSGRSGSSGSGSSRRRSGTSRRSGKSSSSAVAGSSGFTFIRACFLMLACAKLMKAVVAVRARHRYDEVDAPHAAYVIQCAWRRRQQRRRIRERNAVQLLVPWARLYLKRLRIIKERSALLLQRVFRGQVDRSFHQFLYAQMQYNKALDVVLRAVRRWEAQKLLFALRLQRDERVVLLGQCVQGCLRVLRAEQLEWGAIVDNATATLGGRPCVTTQDWVSGVAARTGVVLNPAAGLSGVDHLFSLQACMGEASNALVADTRISGLRRQLVGITQLESDAYLDPNERTRKPRDIGGSEGTVTAPQPASQITSGVAEISSAKDQTRDAHVASTLQQCPTEMHSNELAPTSLHTGTEEHSLNVPGAGSSTSAPVTDGDVVEAYIQLLIRIESAERVELERRLSSEHAAVLHTPELVNQAVYYIAEQQLPQLFAPLLLSMTSKPMMHQAVQLFEAERRARCQIIALYESMPITCLSRPMLNPAAGQRHDNLVELMGRAPDPWQEAEQSERRLYQEWTAYQHRSQYHGTSDTKSINSPRVSYGHGYATTPTFPTIAMEYESVWTPHLGAAATPAPAFLDTPQASINGTLFAHPSPGMQRQTTGIRVRMTASHRSAGAASQSQSSAPTMNLTPPLLGADSVSFEGAPSDSYTRGDAKSKTAIPCPKRRPRGPPLPLLRTLPPATSRAQGQSPHRPSFRGSCSSFETSTHSMLRAPDPRSVTVNNIASRVHPEQKGEAAAEDFGTRHTRLCGGSFATAQNPLNAPSNPSQPHPLDSGLWVSAKGADEDAATMPAAGTVLSGLGNRGHPHHARQALEHHRVSTYAEQISPEVLHMSERQNSLAMAGPPIRADRRTTAVPPLAAPPLFTWPATSPAQRGRSRATPSLSPRLSQVRLLPMAGVGDGDGAAVDSRVFPRTSSSIPSPKVLTAADAVDTMLFSLSAAKQKNENASFTTEGHSSTSNQNKEPGAPQRSESWTSFTSSFTSSSSSSSTSDELVLGHREGDVAPALPRRPPTPPPRRCHHTCTPPPSSSSSKGALEAGTTAILDSTAAAAVTATSSKSRAADQVVGGEPRPESRESTGSSDTNWTLSPTIKPLPALSPTASSRLPPLPEHQVQRQSFALTF